MMNLFSWRGDCLADHIIRTVEEYRALRGDGSHLVYDKSMQVIDDHIRQFLAMSTFLTIAGIDAEGRMDVSPKGDPPGFVKVVDDTAIAIPEREGNRRADTFTNILENPSVALICFVPGMDETTRINGMATLTADPELLAAMEVRDHVPKQEPPSETNPVRRYPGPSCRVGCVDNFHHGPGIDDILYHDHDLPERHDHLVYVNDYDDEYNPTEHYYGPPDHNHDAADGRTDSHDHYRHSQRLDRPSNGQHNLPV